MDSPTIEQAAARRVDMVARAAAAFTAVFAAVIFVLYHTKTSWVVDIAQEDKILENLQAILFFACSVCFAIAAYRRLFRDIVTVLFMVFFFVLAGEEISWGQRIFDFGSGALGDANLQGEFNVHNLEGIHGVQRLVGTMLIAGIVLLPVLARHPWVKRQVQHWRVPLNPAWNAFVFAVGVAYQALPRGLGYGVIYALDEVGESIVALAFLVWSYAALVQASAIPRHQRPVVASRS